MSHAETAVRVGCGSAFASDRLGPAVDLAASGCVDYLCFDALAERTLAQAQVRKQMNPELGYDVRLDRIVAEFAPFVGGGLKVVGNFGAANVDSALDQTVRQFQRSGVRGVRIAGISGDDCLDLMKRLDPVIPGLDRRVTELADRVVSANAYVGAAPIVEALDDGAKWVLGGRIGDASLFVGPICHDLGWELDHWDKVAHATLAGHLLECSTQATGGYFADPPYREVPGMAKLGFPYAEVTESEVLITKLQGTGGLVDRRTVSAQVAYELHDPSEYLTPDVTADFTEVSCEEAGADRVLVRGARGRERPGQAKVLVGVDDGFRVVAEVSYAAAGCVDRARLAAETLETIISDFGLTSDQYRFDLHGVNALVGPNHRSPEPPEVRLRLTALTPDTEIAAQVAGEMERMYVHAPAGGAGVTSTIESVLGIYPMYVDASQVQPSIEMRES